MVPRHGRATQQQQGDSTSTSSQKGHLPQIAGHNPAPDGALTTSTTPDYITQAILFTWPMYKKAWRSPCCAPLIHLGEIATKRTAATWRGFAVAVAGLAGPAGRRRLVRFREGHRRLLGLRGDSRCLPRRSWGRCLTPGWRDHAPREALLAHLGVLAHAVGAFVILSRCTIAVYGHHAARAARGRRPIRDLTVLAHRLAHLLVHLPRRLGA